MHMLIHIMPDYCTHMDFCTGIILLTGKKQKAFAKYIRTYHHISKSNVERDENSMKTLDCSMML